MGAPNPPSPRRASSVRVVTSGRRQVLHYDGKPVPWLLVDVPRLNGLPVLGQRLAEAWKENA